MRFLIIPLLAAGVVLALLFAPTIQQGLDERNSYQAQLHQLDLSARLSAQQEAERARLAAELRGLHVHDHADIARIRQDYGQRIRAHMERNRPDLKD